MPLFMPGCANKFHGPDGVPGVVTCIPLPRTHAAGPLPRAAWLDTAPGCRPCHISPERSLWVNIGVGDEVEAGVGFGIEAGAGIAASVGIAGASSDVTAGVT